MGIPVIELQARMPIREFQEWIAFYDIEPFGSRWQDARAASVACAIYQQNAPKNKRYKVSDFLITPESKYSQPSTVATVEETKGMLFSLLKPKLKAKGE